MGKPTSIMVIRRRSRAGLGGGGLIVVFIRSLLTLLFAIENIAES